jgi:hypothetical protein
MEPDDITDLRELGAAAIEHAGIDEPERGDRFSFVIRSDHQGRPRADGG